MIVDRRTDEQPEDVIEPRGQTAREPFPQNPATRVDMLLHQRAQYRVLVREILVQRSDRHPGPLRDPIGRPRRVPVLGENVSRRIEDPPPRLGGTLLFGLLTRPKPVRRRNGGLPCRKRVVGPPMITQN